MTLEEQLDWVVSEIEASTDFTIIAEIKTLLNSIYGEERNQIVKPSAKVIIEEWTAGGILSARSTEIENAPRNKRLVDYVVNNSYFLAHYQIIIHFPAITIRNARASHEIKDMYVRFFVRPNGTTCTTLQGVRSTLTEAEYCSGYVHSHLQSMTYSIVKFRGFCLGVGEINQVLAVLSSRYTTANFMMLLMHIKNFLEWESKEGTPYMFMENIFRRSEILDQSIRVSISSIRFIARHIIEEIKINFSMDDYMRLFKWSITERSVTVTPTLELERWMGKRISSWNLREMFGIREKVEWFLSLRDTEGRYFSLPEDSSRREPYNGTILNFKGKDIKLEIIEKEESEDQQIYANPKITTAICEEFSRTISKYAITSNRIIISGASGDITEVTKSDKISV